MATKRKSLSSLKKRPSVNRIRNRKREIETLSIYIGDKEVNGVKTPVFGSIGLAVARFLGITPAVLQKMPNGGRYTSASGLVRDYTFVERVLFVATTGTTGGVRYNSFSPVGIAKYPTKISFKAKSATASSGYKTYSIGVPSDTNFDTVSTLVTGVLKLDKNPKVTSWKFGKVSETLRELDGGGARSSAASKKSEAQGQFYIPIGIKMDIKKNMDGSLSKAASGNSPRGLVIATLKETSANLLGFSKAVPTPAGGSAKGTKIDKTFETSGAVASVTGTGYKAFAKLELHTLVTQDENGLLSALMPGTGIHVKVRFRNKTSGRTIGLAPAGGRRTGKTRIGNKYASLLVPAGTPLGMIHQMLMNTPTRLTSFQVSSDGKNYGNSYPLPAKRRGA